MAAAAPAGHSGSFIPLDGVAPATVIHPRGYDGRGGVLPIRVCLRPDALPAGGDPRPAIRNAVATLNRAEATVGNVVVAGSSQIDFESMLLHELGHCLGLGHSALGPSERLAYGAGEAALFHANALPGPNGVLQAFAGEDGVRGTHDDLRGDDTAISWFAIGSNNPYLPLPARVDRSTFSASPGRLPAGHRFPEIASSFAPCVAPGGEAGETQGSTLRLQPPTQSVVYPVLCQPQRVRALAPEDAALLRLARAGVDGVEGSADDHRPRLTFHEQVADCEIDLRFAVGEGFAFCTIETVALAGGDRVIRRATASFDRQVGWLFASDDRSALGAAQDLALAHAPLPTEAAPGAALVVTLELALPAPGPARDVVVAAAGDDGLVLEGIDGAACAALPCALGELAAGPRTLSLRYRVPADAAPGASLAPRWILSADGHDPDGRNNLVAAAITVVDPERILRSGFEAGESTPSG